MGKRILFQYTESESPKGPVHNVYVEQDPYNVQILEEGPFDEAEINKQVNDWIERNYGAKELIRKYSDYIPNYLVC